MCEMKIRLTVKGNNVYLSVYESFSGTEQYKILLDKNKIKEIEKYLKLATEIIKENDCGENPVLSRS